jgi:hypothetical protein
MYDHQHTLRVVDLHKSFRLRDGSLTESDPTEDMVGA